MAKKVCKPIVKRSMLLKWLDKQLPNQNTTLKNVWQNILFPYLEQRCRYCSRKRLVMNMVEMGECDSDCPTRDCSRLYCLKCIDQCFICGSIATIDDWCGDYCDQCSQWHCGDCLNGTHRGQTCDTCAVEDLGCFFNDTCRF